MNPSQCFTTNRRKRKPLESATVAMQSPLPSGPDTVTFSSLQVLRSGLARNFIAE